VRTGLITIAAGRSAHLRRQAAGIATLLPQPDVRVVVAMGRGEGVRARAALPSSTDVIEVDADPSGLPLAAARNAGAAHALAAGAELLVFLDVDCVPGERLLERYCEAAGAARDCLLCGPVSYLPPAPAEGYPKDLAGRGQPHTARPVPEENSLVTGGDHRLFWTLSFAVLAQTWSRIGGFDAGYVGYGGEDTDFGQRALAAGVGVCWVGGAWAYHQHHAAPSPPVQHLDAILRNARRFRDRWGWWPMQGWLDAFAERGLIVRDARTGAWVHAPVGAP
jgi:GT2 family glycosyltransferase